MNDATMTKTGYLPAKTVRVNEPTPPIVGPELVGTNPPRGVALEGGAAGGNPPLTPKGVREVGLNPSPAAIRLSLTASVAQAILSRSTLSPDITNPTAMKHWANKIRIIVDALVEVV